AVMGLQVRGKLMVLTMRLTPRLPAGSEDPTRPPKLNDGVLIDVELVDTANLKRYVVVRDERGLRIKSNDFTSQLHNGQPGLFTYTFAAPEANVSALDVRYGQWPPFTNVPVQR
ncbi:hypothetical protein ACFQ07_11575, partial [Actinomadura adrarensis]